MKRTAFCFSLLFAFFRVFPETIHAEAPPPETQALRSVTVAVFIDEARLRQKGMEAAAAEIKNYFDFCSAEFEKEFGVSFAVKTIMPWEYASGGRSLDADDALNDVENLNKRSPYDIAVGFSPQSIVKERIYLGGLLKVYDEIGGIAFTLGSAAVINIDKEPENVKLILLHELGHIFGAEHTDAANSIMNFEKIKKKNFDEENKKIIRKNRLREFRK